MKKLATVTIYGKRDDDGGRFDILQCESTGTVWLHYDGHPMIDCTQRLEIALGPSPHEHATVVVEDL